jgi:hypothetical protein
MDAVRRALVASRGDYNAALTSLAGANDDDGDECADTDMGW